VIALWWLLWTVLLRNGADAKTRARTRGVLLFAVQPRHRQSRRTRRGTGSAILLLVYREPLGFAAFSRHCIRGRRCARSRRRKTTDRARQGIGASSARSAAILPRQMPRLPGIVMTPVVCVTAVAAISSTFWCSRNAESAILVGMSRAWLPAALIASMVKVGNRRTAYKTA